MPTPTPMTSNEYHLEHLYRTAQIAYQTASGLRAAGHRDTRTLAEAEAAEETARGAFVSRCRVMGIDPDCYEPRPSGLVSP